jgi:restriction system-associated AAA family ATPase
LNWSNLLKTDDQTTWNKLSERNVIVNKEVGKKPVFQYFYNNSNNIHTLEIGDETVKLLPTHIFGYSSGMNELISTPFIKMDFYYFDEYEKKRKGQEFGDININRLFYMDYDSNAGVVLANYLVIEKPDEKRGKEDNAALNVLNKIIDVDGLDSFKIVINYPTETRQRRIAQIDFPRELRIFIDQLENCATLINEEIDPSLAERMEVETEVTYRKRIRKRVEYYYKVDEKVLKSFKDQFGTPFELFRNLHLLKLLNIYNYDDQLRKKIKNSKAGDNVANMVPKYEPDKRIFYIDDIRFRKTNGKCLFYKQLSDGEHQYLHVVGTLMLMQTPGALFLLDEPETHFNPDWRSKLISTLNDVIKFQQAKDKSLNSRKKLQHPQELLLTTHSPFVISDCQRERVYVFEREKNGDVRWKHPDTNTFGASSNVLLKSIFNKRSTIPGLPLKKIEVLEKKLSSTNPNFKLIQSEINLLGESVEKFTLQDFLFRIEKNKKLAKK